MTFIQGRVFANSPDDAALKIRAEHGNGRLWISLVFEGMEWYEYTIEIEQAPSYPGAYLNTINLLLYS